MNMSFTGLALTLHILLTKLLIHVSQSCGVTERESCPGIVVWHHVVQIAIHPLCPGLSSLILQRDDTVGSIHYLGRMLLRELLNGLSSRNLSRVC